MIRRIDGDLLEEALVSFVRSNAEDRIVIGPPRQAEDLLDSDEDWAESLEATTAYVLASLQSDVMLQTTEPWPQVPGNPRLATSPFARIDGDDLIFGFGTHSDVALMGSAALSDLEP